MEELLKLFSEQAPVAVMARLGQVMAQLRRGTPHMLPGGASASSMATTSEASDKRFAPLRGVRGAPLPASCEMHGLHPGILKPKSE
jgi:hypothetical protein